MILQKWCIVHRTGIMRGKMRTITAISDEESDRILGIDSGFEDDVIFDDDD